MNDDNILSKKLNSSFLFINETPRGTTNTSQSGLGCNGKKEILHISQSSKTRISPSDAV